MKIRISGLYAITPDQADTAQLLAHTHAALAGGAAAVQYRSKSRDIGLRHEQAAELTTLCHTFRVPLIVNDDVRLAVLCDADGVHLGEEDMGLKEARINLGPDKIIGVSSYRDSARAIQLEKDGADYIAFGSFYPSLTKPQAPPCPLSELRAARAKLHIPIVAIGGITPQNAQALIEAGADAIAVISSLYDAPDIEIRATEFASLFATRH